MKRLPKSLSKLAKVSSRTTPWWTSERGSAPVGFVLTSVLVIGVFVGLLQTAAVMHARSVAIDVAGHAARLAARLGASENEVSHYLSSDEAKYAGIVSYTMTNVAAGGNDLVKVTVTAKYPILGGIVLPEEFSVSGSAMREEQTS